ncbi:MAG: hypothetical protein ACKVU4_03760 [Phycisphaerales bacterium]
MPDDTLNPGSRTPSLSESASEGSDALIRRARTQKRRRAMAWLALVIIVAAHTGCATSTVGNGIGWWTRTGQYVGIGACQVLVGWTQVGLPGWNKYTTSEPVRWWFDGRFSGSGWFIGAPLWFTCIVCSIVPAVVLMRSRAGALLAMCAGCGYDLAGNTTGICPECGTARPRTEPVA